MKRFLVVVLIALAMVMGCAHISEQEKLEAIGEIVTGLEEVYKAPTLEGLRENSLMQPNGFMGKAFINEEEGVLVTAVWMPPDGPLQFIILNGKKGQAMWIIEQPEVGTFYWEAGLAPNIYPNEDGGVNFDFMSMEAGTIPFLDFERDMVEMIGKLIDSKHHGMDIGISFYKKFVEPGLLSKDPHSNI